jgi:hypothetical protein
MGFTFVSANSNSHIQRRLAIRTTWGWNGHSLATRFRTIFVMGSRLASESNDQHEDFEADRERYGDLLVGDFFDHYNNSTLKVEEHVIVAWEKGILKIRNTF